MGQSLGGVPTVSLGLPVCQTRPELAEICLLFDLESAGIKGVLHHIQPESGACE